jgi:phosphatidylserine decarboxylase
MDPFIVIKHNDAMYRTKVIRHDLNPTFNDKFILFVRRSTASDSTSLSHYTGSLPNADSSTVLLSLLDWEQLAKNRHIGSAILDLKAVFEDAPKPDEETGLYSAEAMRLQKFSEIKLDVGLESKQKWEGNGSSSPTILVRCVSQPELPPAA